jgi:hypothetical protein
VIENLEHTISSLEPYAIATLAIIAATIAVQLLMRFVVGRVVFFIAKRRYLPVHLQQMMDGWSDSRAEQSLNAVAEFVETRLGNRLGSGYRIVDDAQVVLQLASQHHAKKKQDGRDTFSFSLLKLIQCSLLAFSDLEREFGRRRGFTVLRRLRLDQLLKMTRMARSYDRLLHHRFLNWLRQMRLIWRIPTLLLVPVLGPPLFLLYVVRSLVFTTLFEGPARYFYGVFLLRFGYYALYLYNRKNRVIANRLAAISTVELSSEAAEFEERINPKNWTRRSVRFPAAVTCYERLLREFKLPADPISRTGGSHTMRRVWVVLGKVIRKQGLRDQPTNDTHQLVSVLREIGQVYFPGDRGPWLRLRLGEVLDVGYMATVLALHKASSVPGGRRLLDSVSLSVALTISRFSAEAKFGRAGLSAAKIVSKSHGAARKVGKIWNAVAARTFPAALAVSLAGEVALQQISDHYRGYVYHRAGRLVLYGFEQNALGQMTRGARPFF